MLLFLMLMDLESVAQEVFTFKASSARKNDVGLCCSRQIMNEKSLLQRKLCSAKFLFQCPTSEKIKML